MPQTSPQGGPFSASSRYAAIGPQVQLILNLSTGKTFTPSWRDLFKKKKKLIGSIFCVFTGTHFAQPCKPPGGEGIGSNKIIAIPTNYLNWLFYP